MKKIIHLIFLILILFTPCLLAQGLKNAVVLFDQGNRYITSMRTDVFQNSYFSMTNGANDTSFVQKRDSTGTLLWELIWNTSFNVNRVVADHLGNVYVSGYAAGTFDMDPGPGIYTSVIPSVVVVICLDAAGGFLWGRTTQDISGFSGGCSLIDIDEHPDGGVVIYGDWHGSVDIDPSPVIFQPQQFLSWGNRTFLLRLDANGNTISLNSVETDCCNQYEVKCGPNGNYSAGFTANDTLIIFSQGTYLHFSYTNSNQNYCVVEFDKFGALLWKSDLYNAGFSIHQVINYDAHNNLFISAESYGTDLDPGAGVDTSTAYVGGNLFLIKMDTLRNREWIKMIATGFYYNNELGMEINLKGEVFISGTGTNNGINRNGGDLTSLYTPSSSPVLIALEPPTTNYTYLLKLNTCGEKEWERYWSDIGTDLNSYFYDFSLNDTDEIYYCGFTDNFSDLDPDTSVSLYASSSSVNENLVWLHLGKTEYCKPSAYNGTTTLDSVYISTVLLDTIQDVNAGYFGVNSYNDITTSSTTLYPGEAYHLRVIAGPFSTQTTAAWIDFNKNLTFESNELLGNYTSTAPFDTADIYFTVPAVLNYGNFKMRIRSVCCEPSIDPCCYYSTGQTNDYTVTINEGLLDLSPKRIRVPGSTMCAETLLPEVKFQNTGNLLISSFTADLEINGVIVSSISSNQFLYEQDSVFIQFPPYYFNAGMSYTLRVIITSVNGTTDNIGGNDTLLKHVQIFNAATGTITGDSLYCPGEDVYLSANYSTAIAYEWNNGSLTNVFEIIQPDPGFYSAIVTITDANGCVSLDSFQLNVVNAINGIIEGDTTVCDNDTLSLYANYPLGTSWVWQPGSVSDDTLMLTALTAGQTTYSLTVLDSNNCIYHDSALVNILSIASYNILSPSSACENDTVLVQLQSNASTGIIWCDGTTDSLLILQAIPPTINTCYTITDINGCTVTDSIYLPVFATPPVPVIQVSYQGTNNYLIASVAGINSIFTWYENGNIVQMGSSDTLYNPNLSSIYFVVVTNVEGCNSTSGNLLFTGTETAIETGQFYTVYPNPFQDELILNAVSLNKINSTFVRLIDMTGRTVLPVSELSGDVNRINTSSLADGIYLLVISCNENSYVTRIVKGAKSLK